MQIAYSATMSPSEIQSLRKTLGWSQQRLADELGVKQATVSRIEAGIMAPNPSVQKLLGLVAAQVDVATPEVAQ